MTQTNAKRSKPNGQRQTQTNAQRQTPTNAKSKKPTALNADSTKLSTLNTQLS